MKDSVGATIVSSADFAQAKSVAARRKRHHFPGRNPKISDFRRTSNARPYSILTEIFHFCSRPNCLTNTLFFWSDQ